ncbi:MAG: hypothetical protein NTY99_03605 [DPANN group archaeon]|nr:hypothetical protein [DPANN group archaeon]
MKKSKKAEEIHPKYGRWDEQPNSYLLEMQRRYGGFWDARGFHQPSCGNYYVPVLTIDQEDYVYRLEQSPRGFSVTVTVTDPHDKKIADLSIVPPKITVNLNNTSKENLEGIVKFLGGDFKTAEPVKAP